MLITLHKVTTSPTLAIGFEVLKKPEGLNCFLHAANYCRSGGIFTTCTARTMNRWGAEPTK